MFTIQYEVIEIYWTYSFPFPFKKMLFYVSLLASSNFQKGSSGLSLFESPTVLIFCRAKCLGFLGLSAGTRLTFKSLGWNPFPWSCCLGYCHRETISSFLCGKQSAPYKQLSIASTAEQVLRELDDISRERDTAVWTPSRVKTTLLQHYYELYSGIGLVEPILGPCSEWIINYLWIINWYLFACDPFFLDFLSWEF